MASFTDTVGFAFSFQHINVLIDGVRYIEVESIDYSSTIEEGWVYGTSSKVLRRSAGRQGPGSGSITFSDFEAGSRLLEQLGQRAFAQQIPIDVVYTNEDGVTRSFELSNARFTGISNSHSQGPDPLQATFPFSYLDIKAIGFTLI